MQETTYMYRACGISQVPLHLTGRPDGAEETFPDQQPELGEPIPDCFFPVNKLHHPWVSVLSRAEHKIQLSFYMIASFCLSRKWAPNLHGSRNYLMPHLVINCRNDTTKGHIL